MHEFFAPFFKKNFFFANFFTKPCMFHLLNKLDNEQCNKSFSHFVNKILLSLFVSTLICTSLLAVRKCGDGECIAVSV